MSVPSPLDSLCLWCLDLRSLCCYVVPDACGVVVRSPLCNGLCTPRFIGEHSYTTLLSLCVGVLWDDCVFILFECCWLWSTQGCVWRKSCYGSTTLSQWLLLCLFFSSLFDVVWLFIGSFADLLKARFRSDQSVWLLRDISVKIIKSDVKYH